MLQKKKKKKKKKKERKKVTELGTKETRVYYLNKLDVYERQIVITSSFFFFFSFLLIKESAIRHAISTRIVTKEP